MERTPRERLRDRLPAIKSEWQRLLSTEPESSPLGRPGTLEYLMDATLAQLLGSWVRQPDAEWLCHCEPVAGAVHQYCTCGLNPLLRYFSTGEIALGAAAAELGPDLDDVLLRFRMLAQHELEGLCAVCVHPGSPDCPLPPRPRDHRGELENC